MSNRRSIQKCGTYSVRTFEPSLNAWATPIAACNRPKAYSYFCKYIDLNISTRLKTGYFVNKGWYTDQNI
jgi:hypothetical protein